MTIQNGKATSSGGGIRDQGPISLTLTNVTVTNNQATGDGGGIAMTNAVNAAWNLTLTGSTVSNNKAGGAGGGIATAGDNPNNSLSLRDSVTVSTSTISGNTAANQGGGVWIGSLPQSPAVAAVGTVTITNGGSGYTTAPAVTFSPPPAGGVPPRAHVLLANGAIVGVIIDFQGQGYTSTPTVAFAAPTAGGTQATGTVTPVDQGARLAVADSIVSNNRATLLGGGIGASGATVAIATSTIANNATSGFGGGFADQDSQSRLTITDSVFSGNSAGTSGGGAQEGGDDLKIFRSEFRGNSAGLLGGGLFANGSFLIAQVNTFANNTAGTGGGGIELEIEQTTPSLTNNPSEIFNTTITGNRVLNSGGTGGGIDAGITAFPPANSTGGNTAFVGSVVLLNDTINGNVADSGGGIYYDGVAGSALGLADTIVAKNTANTAGPDADNPTGAFTDGGGNLIGVSGTGGGNTGFTDATTQSGTTASPLDPLLGPLGNNGGFSRGAPNNSLVLETEALLPGSKAIQKGIAFSTVLVTPATGFDERGLPRPSTGGAIAGVSDVGAFQFQNLTLGVTLAASSPAQGPGRKVTFTVTVTGGRILGLDNSTVTVTLPAGLTATGPLTFPLGQVDAAQSFTVTAIGTTAGAVTVTATVTSPDANPNTVTASTTYNVLTAQEGFVQAVYLDELGRAGAVAELDYWVGKLNGGSTQTAVASAILHTPEARTHLVKGWYQTYLGRVAVNGEEQYWVNQLLAGQTEEQVLSGVFGTGEFLNHAVALNGNGSPQQSFVNALYQLLLNRSPSGTDLSYWINQVQSVGQQGAALAFLSVPEYRTDTVAGYYNNLLHRLPDAYGLTFWVNSGLDLATVRGDIEGTPEFFTNG